MKDGEPDPAHRLSREEMWEDPQLKPVGPLPGYEQMAEGPIVHAPVEKNGRVIGHLWASMDGRAGSFLPIDSNDADALNAKGVWIKRLNQDAKKGLTSVQALEHWIGDPEDARGGCIHRESRIERATSLDDLGR